MKPNLLIIEDDEDIRSQMKWALRDEFRVATAHDCSSALRGFRSGRPLVTILDLGLPPHPNDITEGLKTLRSIKAVDSGAKVIVVSGQEKKENAIRAVGAGAYDFMSKPLNLPGLRFLVGRCSNVAKLEREYTSRKTEEPIEEFEGMIGSCPSMQKVFITIEKIADSAAPVLIAGESNTGKGMVANVIHRRSTRKDGPFIKVNCSAIPEKRVENELFGQEKGAFTDDCVRRKGLIERAEGGTLFLDEIGSLPMAVQVKLLRFLEEKRIEPIGGREGIEIDTRILTATNADLSVPVAERRFREDLYYRLAVVVCNLPPLQERGEDVSRLAENFLRQYSRESAKANFTFSADAQKAILSHSWPGNVSELQSRIQRAVVMTDGSVINRDDLGLEETEDVEDPSSFSSGEGGLSLKEARGNLDRKMVEQALRKHRGIITAAAAELGVTRPTFYELMDRHEISRT